MSAATPLDVKVIYSASGHRRRGPAFARTRGAGYLLFIALAFLNFLAATAYYYGAWWQVDKFMNVRLMWKTPIVGLDSRAATGFLVPRTPTANDAAAEGSEAGEAPEPKPAETFSATMTQRILGATAYGWLTAASIAAAMLALAAGASVGRVGGGGVRRAGLLVLLVVIVAVGGVGYLIYDRYGFAYPMNYWRAYMVWPVVLGLAIGASVGRGVRGLSLCAAIAVVGSAAASVIALYLGSLCDALEPEHTTLRFMATVFAAQSAWGWLLLAMGWRLPR